METHKLKDLDVDGVIAFLTTIRLEKIFGDEFREQQIDGELLLDGIQGRLMEVIFYSFGGASIFFGT